MSSFTPLKIEFVGPYVETSNLWPIPPNLVTCVISLILFSFSTFWFGVLLLLYRYKFFIPFIVGGLFQFAGYIARAVCVDDIENLGAYVVQTLFILLAPVFYAGAMYSLLERIPVYIGAEKAIPIRPTRITTIFVTGDIISFILQCIGGGIFAKGGSGDETAGKTMILLGLSIQLAFFLTYLALLIRFHIKVRHWETQDLEGNWRLMLVVLEITSFILLGRYIYRIVEYSGGYTGYVVTHEVYFYVFDALLMLIVQIFYNIVHPGWTMPGSGRGRSGGVRKAQANMNNINNINNINNNRQVTQKGDYSHEMSNLKSALLA